MEDKQRLFLISQTYATLFSASNKIQAAGDEVIGALTSRQLMTMIAIAHIPKGKVTLSAIATKIGATKQSTAQIVNNLKNKGYLKTEKNILDGRSVNIVVTASGKEVAERSNAKGWHFLQTLFQDFSNEELTLFWQLLQRLYEFDGELQDGFEADGRKL
ncbi:DNA-binding MarR family transcriptional regulator [Enterococcus sp. PF1-24]|uniref:MarR family winged helix-turn-helix transcriptional regulator n=1 Tax=unclassified Enterococcus TaxID=2608891 RepID=UPI002475D3E3|nr:MULTISPECIES: MarR family winged helix-turn-helix transcriptional regulator [unclassified Enterococcus]MDH6365557.1 DNA-binding MarR family transcriptional regulator [Enterococcus sp. PFB1-1]MDH6402653.1 DNA-binding MarR family transcriptional regulator [Enterococcus sp. PF1-24]